MNFKSRLRNVNNRDYEKFSRKQNMKYIQSQFSALGVEPPKYTENLTPTNLQKALKSLNRRLSSQIKKDNKIRKERKKIKSNVEDELANTINRYNKTVLSTLKKLNTYYPDFMSENIDYLRGEETFNPISRKSFRYDGTLLKLISIQDIYFKDKNSMVDYIIQLKKNIKKVQFKNYEKELTNKTEQENYFKDLINEQGNGLSTQDRKLLLSRFKSLDKIQQTKVNKVGLRQLIQKYKDLYEEGNLSETGLNSNVFNKINSALLMIGGV